MPLRISGKSRLMSANRPMRRSLAPHVRSSALQLLKQKVHAADSRQELGKNNQQDSSRSDCFSQGANRLAPKATHEETQCDSQHEPDDQELRLALHVHPPKHLASSVSACAPTGTEAALARTSSAQAAEAARAWELYRRSGAPC